VSSHFYENKNVDQNLRFGDIIIGGQFLTMSNDKLPMDSKSYQINIDHSDFYCVLTPCCSIEKKLIVVSPLEHIQQSYYSNSFLADDLSRINGIIAPENSIPTKAWENMRPEEKQRMMASGPAYMLIDKFIFPPDDALGEYEVNSKNLGKFNTGYFQISFKNTLSIRSAAFDRNKSYPKILQMSIPSRTSLREKIGYFYSRIPEEDISA
jgi:hypothetical protein